MYINKDWNEFITRPYGGYINRIARFLPVQVKAMKNLKSQIFPERNQKSYNQMITSIYTTDAATKKLDMNIHKQVKKHESSSYLTIDNEDTISSSYRMHKGLCNHTSVNIAIENISVSNTSYIS